MTSKSGLSIAGVSHPKLHDIPTPGIKTAKDLEPEEGANDEPLDVQVTTNYSDLQLEQAHTAQEPDPSDIPQTPSTKPSKTNPPKNKSKKSAKAKSARKVFFTLLVSFIALGLTGACGVMFYLKSFSDTKRDKSIDSQTQELNKLISELEEIAGASNKSLIELQGSVYHDCQQVQNSGAKESGVYSINVLGRMVDVYCDLKTNGGGWTVIQKRINGEVNFYRNFAEYENGFGVKAGEYWLGLKHIYEMSNSEYQILRVDMEDVEGEKFFANYGSFQINDRSMDYKLNIGDFKGNIEDSLSRHNGDKFTTFDKDNDIQVNVNCAFTSHGGWWYNDCYKANLNGKYQNGKGQDIQGIIWKVGETGKKELKTVEMKIKPLYIGHRS